MSEFRGRRDRSGDWEWEATQSTTTALPIYSVPLIIGALVALFMLAYVFAGNSWSFSPVLPNSCEVTASGDASAQGLNNKTDTPTPPTCQTPTPTPEPKVSICHRTDSVT